jgi:hypothetical protein
VGLADGGVASGFWREQHSVVVLIDEERIEAFVRHLAMAVDAAPFDFCSLSEGGVYPERGRSGVLEAFFFSCGHQFGFWTPGGNRWEAPMIALRIFFRECARWH